MLVGVFIGILIAFSIVWWQGNNIGDWGFIRKAKNYISNIFSKHNENNVTVINDNETNKNNTAANNKLTDAGLKNDSAYYDTTSRNTIDPAALDEFLAQYNGHLPDSLVRDSILKSQNNIDINSYKSTGSLAVRSDKIIFAKSYNVPGIDMFLNTGADNLDTLLTDNKTRPQNKSILRVEFWKSPINYKGYKISNNKLVVFGIDQFDMVSYKMVNKVLYLKYMSDYYQIDRTINFKPLVPVNSPQLISQLNSK